jgi:hypothetical protein
MWFGAGAFGAVAFGAGAALLCSSDSIKMMLLRHRKTYCNPFHFLAFFTYECPYFICKFTGKKSMLAD